ncbi:hypothetical protein MKX03_008911 [Papaver bracteatum]|nr:hypothetical protein MKX03_008911 [Papaver bracteatum]
MSIISYDVKHVVVSGDEIRTEKELLDLYESWLIFNDNLKFIDQHNSENHSYQLGLNSFADLTNDEYKSTYLGTKVDEKKRLGNPKSDRYAVNVSDKLPKHVDWREEGAVVDVKNQRSCGSCWAFSTIAAVEASWWTAIHLTTKGCNGGLMDYGFQFIIDNGGIDTEEDYPYNATDDKCDDVPVNDEKAFQKDVSNRVVSLAIEAGGRDFQLYKSGVYYTGICGTDLDHGVNAVGYVRNSWGPEWGEEGYIRMERNLADTFIGLYNLPLLPHKQCHVRTM